jgi:hypothetical protein
MAAQEVAASDDKNNNQALNEFTQLAGKSDTVSQLVNL